MAVLLLKNVISINNKLRNQNENGKKNSVFAVPDMSSLRQQFQPKAAQPQSPQNAPVSKFCSKCGSPLDTAGQVPPLQTTISPRLKRKKEAKPLNGKAIRGFSYSENSLAKKARKMKRYPPG